MSEQVVTIGWVCRYGWMSGSMGADSQVAGSAAADKGHGYRLTMSDAIDAYDRLLPAGSAILVCHKCMNHQNQAHRGI